jgi:hypothetical protein
MSRYFEEEWPHRPKPPKWDDLNRMAKLARCMYPNLIEPGLRNEVVAIARGEGKTDPLTAKGRADQVRRSQSRTKW